MNVPLTVKNIVVLWSIHITYIIGIALSIAMSWSIHKSILWAILHGLCGWAYIVYSAII